MPQRTALAGDSNYLSFLMPRLDLKAESRENLIGKKLHFFLHSRSTKGSEKMQKRAFMHKTELCQVKAKAVEKWWQN